MIECVLVTDGPGIQADLRSSCDDEMLLGACELGIVLRMIIASGSFCCGPRVSRHLRALREWQQRSQASPAGRGGLLHPTALATQFRVARSVLDGGLETGLPMETTTRSLQAGGGGDWNRWVRKRLDFGRAKWMGVLEMMKDEGVFTENQ